MTNRTRICGATVTLPGNWEGFAQLRDADLKAFDRGGADIRKFITFADDRPEKPRKDFPFFAHRCEQWCRKIRGKAHYFGSWKADPAGLLEHLRICQWDILEYSRDPKHVSPEFPDGYWPDGDAPPNDEAWDQSIAAFRADLQAMQLLVSDPRADLLVQIPHRQPGHTILREALLVADHNAYHLGQMVIVRRALGAWPDE